MFLFNLIFRIGDMFFVIGFFMGFFNFRGVKVLVRGL